MGIFIFFFLATKILQSETTATLEIMLVSFENEGGLDYYGSWCDGLFGGQCDHFFYIYLFDHNRNLIQFHSTTSFNERDTIVFPQYQYFNNIYNPLEQKFTTWRGWFYFEVRIYDSDSNQEDYVGTIDKTIFVRPALNKAVSISETMFLWGSRYYSRYKETFLNINIKLYCDTNFFGINCDIECVPMDNNEGHFTCDPTTGAILCLPGWEGISTKCTIFSKNCLENKCQNNAICVEANRNYTCSCLPGYTGRYCETNINECLSSPCKNGGKCKDFINDFFCNCPKNFAGKTCRITACMLNNPCLNGGVCHGHSSCLCQSSYYGEKCENTKIIAINESLTNYSTNQSITNGNLILAFFIFALIFTGIIVFSISLRLCKRRRELKTTGANKCEISIITASAPHGTSSPLPQFNFDIESNKCNMENRNNDIIHLPSMTPAEENVYTILD